MPLADRRHHDIASIALQAAGRRYGVAFGGGGALQAHDLSARRTQDVDLFVQRIRNVDKAAAAIGRALTRRGYRVESTVHAGAGEIYGIREYVVYPPGAGDDGGVQLQIAHFEWPEAEMTAVGPTVAKDWGAAQKLVALLSRNYIRDYIDVAQLVRRGFTPGQLLQGVAAQDPGLLDPECIGECLAHLKSDIDDDQLAGEMPDDLTPQQVRDVFAAWPAP